MSDWSKNPPTEPGWYWWRDSIDGAAKPLEVYGFEMIYVLPSNRLVEMIGGEWFSEQIEPPKE